MITGAGWLSAGPGYRHRVFQDRALFEVSAAVEDVAPLLAILGTQVTNGVRQQFDKALRARKQRAPHDVAAGRAYVTAYVDFIHYLERIHEAIESPAHGHFTEHPSSAAQHGKRVVGLIVRAGALLSEEAEPEGDNHAGTPAAKHSSRGSRSANWERLACNKTRALPAH